MTKEDVAFELKQAERRLDEHETMMRREESLSDRSSKTMSDYEKWDRLADLQMRVQNLKAQLGSTHKQ